MNIVRKRAVEIGYESGVDGPLGIIHSFRYFGILGGHMPKMPHVVYGHLLYTMADVESYRF